MWILSPLTDILLMLLNHSAVAKFSLSFLLKFLEAAEFSGSPTFCSPQDAESRMIAIKNPSVIFMIYKILKPIKAVLRQKPFSASILFAFFVFSTGQFRRSFTFFHSKSSSPKCYQKPMKFRRSKTNSSINFFFESQCRDS